METSNKFLEEDELKAALDWLTADVLCCEKKNQEGKISSITISIVFPGQAETRVNPMSCMVFKKD